MPDVLHSIRNNLVDDGSDHFNSGLLKKALIQCDFVDRSPDPSAGDDDDLGVETPCDLCVGEIEDRTHPGMPGAFNNDIVFFVGGAVKGAAHTVDLDFVLVLGIIQEFTGVGRMNGNGTHRLDGDIHVKDGIEQDGVLVYLLSVHFNEALADGLDEADFAGTGSQGRKERQTGGGFPVIHTGRRDKNTFGGCIPRGTEQFGVVFLAGELLCLTHFA